MTGGQKWERNRRLLTPALHFNVLRPYISIYHDVADILLVIIPSYIWKRSMLKESFNLVLHYSSNLNTRVYRLYYVLYKICLLNLKCI